MKKITFLILGSLLFGSAFAGEMVNSLSKVGDEFVPECYEYVNTLEKGVIGNSEKTAITYKLGINNIYDIVITQGEYLVPYKFFGTDLRDSYGFTDNLGIGGQELSDFNYDTYKEINSNTQNVIILSFDEQVERNNFSFVFNYSSRNYYPEYSISNNKSNWQKIRKSDIESFDFKYLKIKFISNTKEKYLENIRIRELSFYKKAKTILIKSFLEEDIKIYSKNNCLGKKYYKRSSNGEFGIDSSTEFINIDLEKNPSYNVYTLKDSDNDGVEDRVDNCKNIFNPDQLDSDSDNVGDECSDVDKDGIIGSKDNCKTISNPDQKDINRNGVGDKCEFDKDMDGIFDEMDNCITSSNPDQKDKDGDLIGDKCDNCSLFNPRQRDTNNNGLGDVCEQAEKNLLENDEDSDGIIDYKDNCKYVANSDQADSDLDGVGNVCDNCPDLQNKRQIDLDKNNVGDMCEDSDLDGIMGYLDNCINNSNNDQTDSDNDGVGNVCEDDDRDGVVFVDDNCPSVYNKDQKDIDKDGIGDRCDDEDNRYIESNKAFFIGLLIFITMIFGAGIFFMMRKLK